MVWKSRPSRNISLGICVATAFPTEVYAAVAFKATVPKVAICECSLVLRYTLLT